MGNGKITNQTKTVKKIYKNIENTKGFDDFKPNWQLEFSDGSKAKLTLSQENADMLCEILAEGRAYTFTLEDGVYNNKAWTAIRDVLVTQAAPPPKPSTGAKPPVDTTMPLSGPAIGCLLNNATLIVAARIDSGGCDNDVDSIVKDLHYFAEKFETMYRRGTFIF